MQLRQLCSPPGHRGRQENTPAPVVTGCRPCRAAVRWRRNFQAMLVCQQATARLCLKATFTCPGMAAANR